MRSVVSKFSLVSAVLCLFVLIPVFVLMGLGLKAIESEQTSQHHRQQAEAKKLLLEAEGELQESFSVMRQQMKAYAVSSSTDIKLMREMMYLGDPFEVITVFNVLDNQHHIRVFPPEDVAGVITEQQQVNRYREEISALQKTLLSAPESDLIVNVHSDEGETLLNCWNADSSQLCVVFNNAWVGRTLKRSLRELNKLSTITAQGKFSVVAGDSNSAHYHTQVRGYHSQSRNLMSPLSAWKVELTVESETLYENHIIMYVSMIIPAFIFMVLIAFWLYRQQRRTEKEMAAKAAFLAELSHELRTPLANIRLYVALMQMQGKDQDITKYLNTIDSEAERLSRLVENATLLARSEGSNDSTFLEVVPNELIDLILTTFQPLILNAGNEVVTDLQTNKSVIIDALALEHTLINLLDNCCKYAAKSKITIKSWQTGKDLYLHVQDQGPGIDFDVRQSLFTPYQNSTHRVDGFGLGLAVCQRLMHRGEGEIVLLPTEIDQGAVFQLKFPLQDAASVAKLPNLALPLQKEDVAVE